MKVVKRPRVRANVNGRRRKVVKKAKGKNALPVKKRPMRKVIKAISDRPGLSKAFSFKVQTEEANMEEQSDANGERTGSYSYTNPNGETVEVHYRAGRNGFVILNPDEVLPKPPQAY